MSKKEIPEDIIKISGKGTGYFPNPDSDEDYEIQPDYLAGALNRDTVKIEPLKHEVYGRKQAKVVEIVKRHKTEFVGLYEEDKGRAFVIPDDKRVYRDILISKDKSLGAQDGDKVQAKITKWDDPSKNPEGEVVRVIGPAGKHETEMQAIVYDSGFDIDFPPEVEEEAQDWKERFDKEDRLKDRRDMRGTTTFTIDPADAKDFDDALSFKKLGDNKYEVGIHIADVSHFVEEGTALDKEAKHRGTSIYLVDRTIPMLPEVLSNDLCSLNPHEDKYAFSAIFEMDSEANVSKRWFGKTLINSDRRFTYEEAQKVLDTGTGDHIVELQTLDALTKKLREEKFKQGAIDFDSEEVRFELDDQGVPIKVYKKERLNTHKLIEDLMLLANREVAKYMHSFSQKNPKAAFVYRIHDAPDREKIINLATFVKALGFELTNKDGEATARDIAKMLNSVKGSPAETLIQIATIRSMSKAVYSTANVGHFGLAFDYYTHFTSPIRRYPDLMVHRLLQRFLTHGKVEQNEIIKYQRLSSESSERELEAAEAERASIKYKQVEYMTSHIGEEFEATVSGVSEWGIYVEEVETKAEGMVKLRDMEGDFYELDEKHYRVVGQKTGKTYALGDPVKVKLINADPERKNLDFVFV